MEVMVSCISSTIVSIVLHFVWWRLWETVSGMVITISRMQDNHKKKCLFCIILCMTKKQWFDKTTEDNEISSWQYAYRIETKNITIIIITKSIFYINTGTAATTTTTS